MVKSKFGFENILTQTNNELGLGLCQLILPKVRIEKSCFFTNFIPVEVAGCVRIGAIVLCCVSLSE